MFGVLLFNIAYVMLIAFIPCKKNKVHKFLMNTKEKIETLKAEIEYLINFLFDIKENEKYTNCFRAKMEDQIALKKYELWKLENENTKE